MSHSVIFHNIKMICLDNISSPLMAVIQHFD